MSGMAILSACGDVILAHHLPPTRDFSADKGRGRGGVKAGALNTQIYQPVTHFGHIQHLAQFLQPTRDNRLR